jgi:hypothetical protein
MTLTIKSIVLKKYMDALFIGLHVLLMLIAAACVVAK